MKLSLANEVRAVIINKLLSFMADSGEDVGMINSNTFNFPYVFDGEECFVEVTAKVVKKESDECYQERGDYSAKLAEKEEKRIERERAAVERKAKAEAKKNEKKNAE